MRKGEDEQEVKQTDKKREREKHMEKIEAETNKRNKTDKNSVSVR